MANEDFLASAKPELARYVSKTGDFALVENVIDQCKVRLDTGETVSLYEYIRDESGRLEEERRDEFIEAFDNIEPFLPDVSIP